MTTETQPEVWEMSDEAFLAQDFTEEATNVEDSSNEQGEEAEAETPEEETAVADEVTDKVEEEDEAEETDEDETSEETSDGTSDASSEDEASEVEEAEADETDETEEVSKKDKPKEEEEADNYKAQIDELFAPIQANGKKNTIRSVEEARKFISMGMGYTKSMESLKPARLLQQKMKEHGLLAEGKLDFLIALDKKDPAAIAKLFTDANLDPLNMNMEAASSYQPEAYSGGEDKLALDDVLTDLENSENAPEIVSLLSTKWGESSRVILRSKPALLNILDSHMNAGIYDSIMERLEQEKMLGSYMGVSEIEAYGQVAERMNGEGLFAHLSPPEEKPVAQTPRTITKAIKPKRKIDPNLEQKKASATTKSKPATSKPQKAYLNMTDEEFMASM